jgi:hypothetical protein
MNIYFKITLPRFRVLNWRQSELGIYSNCVGLVTSCFESCRDSSTHADNIPMTYAEFRSNLYPTRNCTNTSTYDKWGLWMLKLNHSSWNLATVPNTVQLYTKWLIVECPKCTKQRTICTQNRCTENDVHLTHKYRFISAFHSSCSITITNWFYSHSRSAGHIRDLDSDDYLTWRLRALPLSWRRINEWWQWKWLKN